MITSTETSIRSLNEAIELNVNRDGSWRTPNIGDAIKHILEISLLDESQQIYQRHTLHSEKMDSNQEKSTVS